METLIEHKVRILSEVRDILTKDVGIMESEISMDCDLLKDLGLDSLDLADLVFRLEVRFNIRIKDEDMAGIKTIGDIVDYLDTVINPGS
ncbi:acyl carrier protein [Fulvivirga kasyanovii]|uniref:Acyl carrier protein n=1 Tax=Fulvivirga kasyanovii TaxID=396812 RepID=A0ABW9RTQ1_9BACT|nr:MULTISPECIES: acyl carrier protein [Fulvivirga]MTI27436.1 acyl carrier protein [Fulvivirga kasyanovii]UII34173.1 acyl carrier protein [Fulvivirga ulvae]